MKNKLYAPLTAALWISVATAACSSDDSVPNRPVPIPRSDAAAEAGPSAEDSGTSADVTADAGAGPEVGSDATTSLDAGSARDGAVAGPLDPKNAPKAVVDRFSDAAAHLWKRSAMASLPAANAAIAFDAASLPFLVHGFGPAGQDIHYYNFDVQSVTPGTVYVLTNALGLPVPGQLALTDSLPGDPEYNDLVAVVSVTTPAGYVANTLTNVDDLRARMAANAADFTATPTNIIRNLVTVPYGSTANLRLKGGATQTELGWYKNQVVSWLVFDEQTISAQASIDTSSSPAKLALSAPHIDIYVTFNKNPDPADPSSGPASGFKSDADGHVHNVVSVLPPNATYSPLWDIDIYDNAAYPAVDDLRSALAAKLLALNAAEVNCPVVEVNAATQSAASLSGTALDPATAPTASVDRFGPSAVFFNRAKVQGLPVANAPVDFDAAPFLVSALGEGGTALSFYNFDAQIAKPAQAYTFVNTKNQPVAGQLPVIDVLPGDATYSDFFQLFVVTVPDTYVPNTLHNAKAVKASGLPVQATEQLAEWVVAPRGSTATRRYGGFARPSAQVWIRDQVAYAIPFGERDLAIDLVSGQVPTLPAYAALSGAGSDVSIGFEEDSAGSTHNVLSAEPGDDAYVPLWSLNLYAPAAFAGVTDLPTAQVATPVSAGVLTLHAPVVFVSGQTLPLAAVRAPVDRFSEAAGMLWRRSANPSLPGANAAVAFDSPTLPFLVHGFGPAGEDIFYYNFDVQPLAARPVYILTNALGRPVVGQLPIVDTVPGDSGYSDLADIVTVTVPAGYVANTITSATALLGLVSSNPMDYGVTDTNEIRNQVVVPAGSTANRRLGGGPAPTEYGWYKGQLVGWLVFDEAAVSQQTTLGASAPPTIVASAPHIDIYVTFNKNPSAADPTSGPASGFKADPAGHVHNVVSVLPPSLAYSPLWDIDIYDNSAFATVRDLPSALAAPLLKLNAAEVNCPVVTIQ